MMRYLIENVCNILTEIDKKFFHLKKAKSNTSNAIDQEFVFVDSADYKTTGSLKNIIFFENYPIDIPAISRVDESFEKSKKLLSECINLFNEALETFEYDHADLNKEQRETLRKAITNAVELTSLIQKMDPYFHIQLTANIQNLNNSLEIKSKIDSGFISIHPNSKQ